VPVLEKLENELTNKTYKKTVVLLIFAFFFLFSGIFGIFTIERIESDNYYITDGNSDMFTGSNIDRVVNTEAVRYVKNLNRFYIYFKNFDSNAAYKKLKEIKDIITEKFNVDNLPQTEKNLSNEYDNYNRPITEEETDEYSYLFEKAPESYYNVNITDTLKKNELINMYTDLKEVYENYELVKNYLKDTKSFQYKIENSLLGKIYTNNNSIDTEEFYYKFYLDDSIFSSEKFNGELLSASFEQNNLKGYIIVPKNFYDNKDTLYINIRMSERMNILSKYIYYIVAGLFILTFIVAVYILLKERKPAYQILKKVYYKYKRIPFFAKLILSVFSLLIIDSELYYSVADSIYYIVSQVTSNNGITIMFILNNFLYCAITIIFTINFFLFLIFLIDMLRKPSKFKNEYEVKIILDIFRDTKYIFNTENYGLFILYLFLIIGTLCSFALFITTILYSPSMFHFLIICILEILGLIVVNKIISLILAYCKLSYCINNMNNDNNNIIDIIEKNSFFMKPFEGLKLINNDINKKIEEMTKNERLKTELITNVSHDLKTPLTSIINYIDLLKEEKIDNPSVNEYISILDNKSQRLKTLIDDLFEASKLSSKQFELDVSKSDIVALLKQTIGEFNYKIEESNINFIIELPNNPIILNIDGQQVWRVFDNLLNNIIKYSPEKSRAYISLEENDDEVKIIMKNVSKAPLNFEADELFERFKRGDASRTTEGSGLGLSIAKSIIELHGGKIFIDIDGDLFKVIVLLKK